MKKNTIYIWTIFLAMFSTEMHSQVGIGIENPRGALDINSSTQGLVYPVVSLVATNVQTLTNPSVATILAPGTTVYNDNTVDADIYSVAPGMYTWDGTEWVPQFSKKDYKFFEQSADVRTGSSDITYGDQTITFSDNTFVPRNYGNYKVLVTLHYGAGTVDVPSSPQFANFVASGGQFDFTFNGTTTSIDLASFSGYNNDRLFNGGSVLVFENQFNQTTLSTVENLNRGTSYSFTLTFNQDTANGFEQNGDALGFNDGRGYVTINNAVKCTVEITYVGK
ncbi:MAG: hypothetical protein K0U54_00880 [Bacteroidetes bacterium]|nr:hypothetical protein [Bacteroidota bacterium]